MPLALGTDTAGSGRVPAMLNNIVGLKPSLGLISTAGVVPACRTLDCVSVFSLTVDDAMTALHVDGRTRRRRSVFARPAAGGDDARFPHICRLGVPRNGQLIFFGDKASEKAYGEALKRWTSLGATLVEFDLEPFYETARLLYEGPWVAERYLVIRNLLASSPDSIHPVTREITAAGARLTAADTFAALYRLQALRRIAERAFANIDAHGAADGADRLLDRAGAGQSDRAQQPARHLHQFRQSARPLRPGAAGGDAARRHPVRHHAAGAGRAGRAARQHRPRLPCRHRTDARRRMRCRSRRSTALPASASGDEIAIAVVGAHLSGMALNGELKALGGRLLETAATAPDYKLYALDTTPPKPGMLRVEAGKGSPIELEVWALPAAAFGKFVAAIPPPLSIGTVRLADGRGVKGFIVEPADDRRRARYFGVRRLARVYGGSGGVKPHVTRRD